MPLRETSDATFRRDVLEHDRPVLVDFWGPACAPCAALEPKLEALADEYAGQLDFVRVTWPEQDDICAAYGVSVVPTLLLFHRGKPLARFDGYESTTDLRRRLEELIAAIV